MNSHTTRNEIETALLRPRVLGTADTMKSHVGVQVHFFDGVISVTFTDFVKL